MDIEKVGTHNGSFHLDELMAVSMLKIYNPSLEIVRTRNTDVLNSLDARVDVGGKYDPKTNDFDHHQRGGAGKRENGVRYASAGLIWKHYGEYLAESPESHAIVDKRLIQYIDAVDNGDITPDRSQYSLFDVIKRANTTVQAGDCTEEEAFNSSLLISNEILVNEIASANYQTKANVIVRGALRKHKRDEFVVLERELPWEPVLVNESDKLYAIYKSTDGFYRVRAVPTTEGGFESRQLLPVEWRGLTNHKLQEVTGIKDSVFCHDRGFVAATKSLEGALQLVRKVVSHMKELGSS